LIDSIEVAAKDRLIDSLTSQQSITLTISGVVAAFLGLLLSGLTILRELKLDRNTSEVETLKNETKKLIRELRSTYDVLIIKNSFSNLEKGALVTQST
jgi:ligand-binding sensor protein